MLALLTLLPLLFALTEAAPTLTKRYTGVRIVSNRTGQCLAAAPKTVVGSVVDVVECNSPWAGRWNFDRGSGSITLAFGSPLALDAGVNPVDGSKLKVWTSYPGLYQQTWYYTNDNRIAITGGTLCLDDGGPGVGAQTWTCTTGNTNQIWTVQEVPDGPTPPSSSSAAPSSTPSTTPPSNAYADVPYSGSYPADPPSGPDSGRRIRIAGRNDLCLTVQGGFSGVGSIVAISVCSPASSPLTNLRQELWTLPVGTGQVKLGTTGLCLDAGINPGDGSRGMKVWTCLDVPQQQWTFERGLLRTTNGQCLDVAKESGPRTSRPYNSVKDVQTWTCSQPDPYQAFQLYEGPSVGQ